MTRTCFVIMPFSATASCSEEEWDQIFDEVFRPAIENAGLDYECRRSTATRGNLVGSILRDLKAAYVVLADLTDQNANVFYELGVRHSFSDRSIIVAQKRDHIPFDLQAYANHIYDWKTDEGRAELTDKLIELLKEIDVSPNRPDNPVSDYLGRERSSETSPTPPPITIAPADVPSETSLAPPAVTIAPSEAPMAQPLAGIGAEGLDAVTFAQRIITSGSSVALNPILRLTRNELNTLMREALEELNARPSPGSIQENQIPVIAPTYVTVLEPHVGKIEEFILTCVEQDWEPGTRMGLKLAGDWISLSQQSSGVRFASGVPALLAWRLVILMGAKAIANDAFESLGEIMGEPIEVKHLNGRMSFQAFPLRSDLFHPETFLGHANHAITYLKDLWQGNPHLQPFFGSEEDWHLHVAMFLMLVALEDAKREEGYSLYPGYRLMPQAVRAMNKLCGRLHASGEYLSKIAKVFAESPTDFRNAWSARVKRANDAGLGSGYFPSTGAHFPDPMNANVEEW